MVENASLFQWLGFRPTRQTPEDRMQVSVTTTEGLERQMKVAVPAEKVDNEVLNRLKAIGKRTRIKGFRQGKVPLNILQRDYGVGVRNEVVGDVVQSSFIEALTQESIKPAGRPRIDDKFAEPGQALTYTAVFEIYPTLDHVMLEGFELEVMTAEITDSEIGDVINRMRDQRKEWQKTDRAAASGDRVRIDFVGSVDGKKFLGGEAEDYPLTLGAGTMLEGFEDPLIGAKAGEKRDVDITFPDGYTDDTLAGKAAHFDVTVNSVEEAVVPELNADFVERMGIEDGNLETLRAEVKTNMQRELDTASKAMLKQKVFDALADANQFDLPNALIEQEIDSVLARAQQQASQRGRKSDVKREDLREEAQRRVKLGIILSEVVLKNKMKVSQKELREFIVAETASYEHPEEAVKMTLSDKERMEGIEPLVLEDKVIDFIVEKAKISTKAIGFDELMARRG
ncbi:trigger factor [Beggiatoa alba]|nr:trigger factor [Beggiatoa alba]